MKTADPFRAGAVAGCSGMRQAVGVWIACLACASAMAQVSPATPVTSSAAAPVVSSTASGDTANGPARHRALVILNGNQIEVRADNSSLNQILREISQTTGMTVSGGVRDERVYGNYGPGPAADVLSSLLQDTGVNMLLKMTPQGVPAELILSQRTGVPGPPSPTAAGEDPADSRAAMVEASPSARQAGTPQPIPASAPAQTQVPPMPFSQPATEPPATDTFRTPQTPSPAGIVSAPTVAPSTEPGTTPGPDTQSTGTSGPANPPPASGNSGDSNPPSPNGVKTPQQIYQELQKLLQQQQQQPGTH